MQTFLLPAGCAAVSPSQFKSRGSFHAFPTCRVSSIARSVNENRLHHFACTSSVSESICVSDPLLKKLTVRRCVAMASSEDFVSSEIEKAKLAQVVLNSENENLG